MPEEPFLRQVLARNPSVQAEVLSVEGSRVTHEGATSLLLPQFNVSGQAAGQSDLDKTHGYSGQASATASQYVPTGGTLQAQILGEHSSSTVPSYTYSPDASLLQTIQSAYPALPAPATSLPIATAGGTSTRDTLGIGLSFTQPLLRGFGEGSATSYQIEQARTSLKLQTAASRSTVLALLSQARKAWWTQRSLEAVLSAHIQDTLRTYRLLAAARVNLSQGSGAVLDTLQAFADHLQTRSDWLTAWTAARAGAVDLGSYLDTTELWALGPTPDSTAMLLPSDPLPAWESIDTLLNRCANSSPDILQALAQEEKARSERIFRDRETLPTLTAGASVRKALLPDDAVPKGLDFGIQANFSWDIPDGVNRAAARKALLDLRKSGIASVKARNDLRRTLLKYLDQAHQHALSLQLARQLIDAQRTRLAASEQSFKDGAIAWTDLVAARRDWMNALSTAWSQLAAAEGTESDLQSLTGSGVLRLGWNWGE